jgi:hypothetical protein
MNKSLKIFLVMFPYSIVIGGILFYFHKKSNNKK